MPTSLDRARAKWLVLGLFPFLLLFTATCGQGYRDISTANGREAIIQQANDFLTAGLCNNAIEILQPLVVSQYSGHDDKMVYASAYACLAGFNFINLIAAITNPKTSIWSTLVSVDPSIGPSDGKVADLQEATTVLRMITNAPGTLTAANRPADTNLYMLLLQSMIISTTISQVSMGNANASTGQKTQPITGTGSTTDQCNIVVAAATIADSAVYASTVPGLSTLQNEVSGLCTGACLTNLDRTVCGAPQQLEGAALIAGIDPTWL